MTEQREDVAAPWIGRELFDANGLSIGMIAGLAFPRRKFGTQWLSVDGADAARIPVPLVEIRTVNDRLVLPYPRSYVMSGPALTRGRPLPKSEQRRLGLHYGFDAHLPGASCCQTCDLCRSGKKK